MTTQQRLLADKRPELAPAARLMLLAGRSLVAGQHEGLDPGEMIALGDGGGFGLVEHGGSWHVRLLSVHYAAHPLNGSAQARP